MKLKTIADFEVGKRAGNIGSELGTIGTIVADKQKYQDVAKLAIPNV
jgi:hypothetical protein